MEKIIHYCWFGGNPFPDDFKKYIETWRQKCPDYEIKEWNESNFDISVCPYVYEAYKLKKWAFITDYARLWIIYHYGGIYMDTDVELLKPFSIPADCKAFFGFEENRIATGLGFGAEKGNPIIKKLMDSYEHRHFITCKGGFCNVPCPTIDTPVFIAHGLIPNGKFQVIDGIYYLPEEYLCPMNWKTHEMTNYTDHTISIHHYKALWLNKPKKKSALLQISEHVRNILIRFTSGIICW